MLELQSVLSKICHILVIAFELALVYVTVVLREWWLFSILLLLGMFMVIITSYLISRRFGSLKKRSGIHTKLDLRYPDAEALETTALNQNVLSLSFTETDARHEVWSRLATRTYVAMALSSVVLCLASSLPSATSPLWYSLVLSGFTFASAYFVYKSWGKQG